MLRKRPRKTVSHARGLQRPDLSTLRPFSDACCGWLAPPFPALPRHRSKRCISTYRLPQPGEDVLHPYHATQVTTMHRAHPTGMRFVYPSELSYACGASALLPHLPVTSCGVITVWLSVASVSPTAACRYTPWIGYRYTVPLVWPWRSRCPCRLATWTVVRSTFPATTCDSRERLL